jgi:tetratricopeptide (TPR) repeat protein
MLSWFCPMVFIATQKKKTKVSCGSRLRLAPLGCLPFALALSISACISRPNWFFGLGGKYNEANIELLRGRGGNLDKAIGDLESIVQDDPGYRDSLTLLGKAYYKKGRYHDSFSILQRALVVNKDDEIAWLFYGLTQIKLGDNEKGLETIKGGLTLLGKAMRNSNYRDYPAWDPRGTVRASLNRAVFQALKGLQERENLIQVTEILLARIDEEEWFQRQGRDINRKVEQG